VAKLTLNDNLYIQPTPAGAYHAVASDRQEPARRLLFRLMSYDQSPLLTLSNLKLWSGADSEEEALDLLFRIQELGWIAGETVPSGAPTIPLEDALPDLLPTLSDRKRVLLADNLGFHIASHGFAHEMAESLSAISADLSSLYNRHQELLHHNLGQPMQSWGLIDASGNSQLGFWPLFFGQQRFILVLNGLPQFNQPAFQQVVWSLARRYVDAEMLA
jgi:hypothetical protein